MLNSRVQYDQIDFMWCASEENVTKKMQIEYGSAE